MRKLVAIEKLRNDPIASGLIVAFISFVTGQLGTFVYNLFVKDFSVSDAYVASTQYLAREIQLKWIVLTLIFVIPIYFIGRTVRKRLSKDPYSHVDLKAKIGEYRFGELFNIMVATELEIPTRFYMTGVKKMNLVQLFLLFQKYFNMGVSWDHAGEEGQYMYYKLGPELMSFGLTEKITRKRKFSSDDKEQEEIIQTSQSGYKFHAFTQKMKLYTEIYPQDAARGGKRSKADSVSS